MGLFSKRLTVLSDNILIKKYIYDPLSLNYIITSDNHDHLLALTLKDIEANKDFDLFLVNWSTIPFNWHGKIPKIKSDMISNIFTDFKLFNWEGVIGRKGVQDKLRNLAKSIEENANSKHIACGPDCGSITKYISNDRIKVVMYYIMIQRDYFIQDIVEMRNDLRNLTNNDFKITLILTTEDNLLRELKSDLNNALSKGKHQKVSNALVSFLESTL